MKHKWIGIGLVVCLLLANLCWVAAAGEVNADGGIMEGEIIDLDLLNGILLLKDADTEGIKQIVVTAQTNVLLNGETVPVTKLCVGDWVMVFVNKDGKANLMLAERWDHAGYVTAVFPAQNLIIYTCFADGVQRINFGRLAADCRLTKDGAAVDLGAVNPGDWVKICNDATTGMVNGLQVRATH